MKLPFKRVFYDVAGFCLIIISPFIGSIPGPGGIILFLTGLTLLSRHNKWAEDLLAYAKKNADSMLEIIFPVDNPKVMLIHDFITMMAYILAIAFYMYLGPPWQTILCIMAISMATFWLLYNRRRYKVLLRRK